MKNFGFYVLLPISLLVLPFVFHATFDGAEFYFGKESGAVENITVILLAIALIVTLRPLLRLNSKANTLQFKKFTAVWLVVHSLGCIYFLGEEISWGQHLFNWSTPEAWIEVNDQSETNLHNTSALFDQVPRTLLTLGIIVGGFFLPIIQRFQISGQTNDLSSASASPAGRSAFSSQYLPGIRCVPAALCVLLISLHEKFYELLGITAPAILQIDDGEVKESLIAMFILVYIVDFCHRDFERSRQTQDAPASA